ANAEDAQHESHSRRVFLEGQLREADSALAQAREAVARSARRFMRLPASGATGLHRQRCSASGFTTGWGG
ncbi:MAG TPA: hypothetical protein VL132_20210, partial [Planctomycetaceae bacterium]|nr:hypothetical protein [Planctomycetaceae bacterium]